MGMTLNDVWSLGASIFRIGRGMRVEPYNREHPPRPEETLELYDFEACPFCRKVREVLSELDLNYIEHTCGQGAEKKRREAEQLGGKRQFPFLVDPNTGEKRYESEAIIDYLRETYGEGRSGTSRMLSPLNTVTAGFASMVRPRGGRVRSGLESRPQPAERLILYSFEISPFCRKVRERLCELNLDYAVRNVAKKSPRRPELVERGGTMMVPYLIDPNTGKEMYESDDILDYLEETYGEVRQIENQGRAAE